MGEDTIQTPYGELCATALNEMQSSFDTRHLLGVVDALDRFCPQWKGEWRAALLGVHSMAHTVINGAPLSGRRDEKLSEWRTTRTSPEGRIGPQRMISHSDE
jgi:hypothetical protein